ncbi:MAG: hypothetical protein AB4042_12290 [Leptolyngbyaceae cyanobacterium]
MSSAPQDYRWSVIGLVLGSTTVATTLPIVYQAQSLADTHVFRLSQFHHLSQATNPPPELNWGEPGGSQATDFPTDPTWGEPGGSRLVTDMADDIVDFYQWGEPGGSRSLEVCSIAPFSERLEDIHGPINVWSDRPLLLWQNRQEGAVRRVVIDDLGLYLFNQRVDSTDFMVRHGGDPLQPGQFYELVFQNGSGSETGRFSFSTLSAADRDAVSADLAQLEAQVMASGATAEELALWRSRFFIQHDLRLLYDGLDALFSVENPSPELVQRQQELLESLCAPTQDIPAE